MTTYSIHPLCDLMPALTEAEYQALKDSIAETGQHQAILVNSANQVIDGRHRLRACQELGIEPKVIRTERYPIDLVAEAAVAQTIGRRLNKSQLAIIAASIAADGKWVRDGHSSVTAVAKRFGLSPGSVSEAGKVLAEADAETIAAIRAGKMSCRKAYNILRGKDGLGQQDSPVNISDTEADLLIELERERQMRLEREAADAAEAERKREARREAKERAAEQERRRAEANARYESQRAAWQENVNERARAAEQRRQELAKAEYAKLGYTAKPSPTALDIAAINASRDAELAELNSWVDQQDTPYLRRIFTILHDNAFKAGFAAGHAVTPIADTEPPLGNDTAMPEAAPTLADILARPTKQVCGDCGEDKPLCDCGAQFIHCEQCC